VASQLNETIQLESVVGYPGSVIRKAIQEGDGNL